MEPLPPIWQDEDGRDYGEGMRERMFLLACSLSAPTIVEIGMRTGNSLRIWAAAIQQIGGDVTSIDVRHIPRARAADSWEIPYGCTVIMASSHLVTWDRPIDLLYIDGDHSVAGCRRDLQVWWPRVRVGGHVLLHDITNEGHYVDPIPLINGWCRANSCTFEVWPNHCGMAHIVKPGGESDV